jgi:hypothetical protein
MRTTYHVLPHPEGGWQGKMEDGLRASVTGSTKEEVLEKTISLARDREPSSVIVHQADGSFQEERTYGNDPFPPEG